MPRTQDGAKPWKRRKDGKYDTGRKSIMTNDVVAKLENVFSIGGSDVEACLMAGISRDTLYDYQKAHPEFVDRKNMLKEKLVLKARTVIANALNKEDRDMAKWYLEKKKKNEFGKDDAVNVSVTTQNNISIDEGLIRSMNEEIRKDD